MRCKGHKRSSLLSFETTFTRTKNHRESPSRSLKTTSFATKMAQRDLILYDASGAEYPYEDSRPSLESENFTHYKVVEGKWILHRNANFNGPNSTGKDILLLEKPTPKTRLPDSFNPRSIRRLQDSSDTAEVFEHAYYGGKSVAYTYACEDVTKSFPANNPQGASSIMIWPNKSWELFKSKLFQGGTHTLSEGKYPTPSAMGFSNDALQSLRPS